MNRRIKINLLLKPNKISMAIIPYQRIINSNHKQIYKAYLQIAFAEELYIYCQANNILFSELRDALNTKWNVEILEPRDGIGGHCLPKDTKMFLTSSKMRSKILQSAMEVDTLYRDLLTRREKKLITPVDNLTN